MSFTATSVRDGVIVARWLRLLLVACAVMSVIVACVRMPVRDASVFDQLVTRATLARELGADSAFDFAVDREGPDYRRFEVALRLDGRDPLEHYALEIVAAKAGEVIDADEHRGRRRTFATDGGSVEADFPSIGMRAQREFLGAGPGGAAQAIAFTTSDGVFDVRITLSMLLPAGVPAPDLDLEAFARRLSDAYDRTAGRRAGATHATSKGETP